MRTCAMRSLSMRSSPGTRPDDSAALVRALCDACEARDVAAIIRLVASDVVVVVDSGGEALVAGGPAYGLRDGVRLLLRLLVAYPEAVTHEHSVNGAPGMVLRSDGVVVAVVSVEVRGGRVADVWAVANPEKLRSWNRG